VTALERALVALGQDLEVPESPDLAPIVRSLLDRQARPSPRRRWALAVALAALATLAATLAIPEARSALFRALHIGGARIELVEELPDVPVDPGLELTLGKEVSLDEARREASFDLRELDEKPGLVFLGDRGTVWFLYGAPERPRLLVAQTPRHAVDPGLLLKKLLAAGTRVEPVTVGGSPGAYLSGEPHFLVLLDEHGFPVEDSARLARDVLLWDTGGVAFRLEGDFTRDEAVELAESLH
jgi:hypothetical protein